MMRFRASASVPKLRLRFSVRRRYLPHGRTRPGSDGPTRAGAKCTRAQCFRAIRNRFFPNSSGRTRPALAHRGDRRLGQRLGIDIPLFGEPGSITTPERSPCGTVCDAARPCREGRGLPSSRRRSCARASPTRPSSASTGRVRDRVGEARLRETPIALQRKLRFGSKILIIGSLCRLPTSKSLKSCAGVIFTAPVPFSGSE